MAHLSPSLVTLTLPVTTPGIRRGEGAWRPDNPARAGSWLHQLLGDEL